MDPVLKQAIKDLLHLIVDKEEPQVIQDLLGKLPASWASVAQALAAGAMPSVVAAQDKVVDSL